MAVVRKVDSIDHSPPCGIIMAALRARATSSVACRTPQSAGDRRKKKRPHPRLISTRRSTCAFPQPQMLSSAVETHYNEVHHEHTPRGRGLAMIADQSCIAGPSVCCLSCATRLFSGPYPPFSSLGNTMALADPAGERLASAGPPRRERMHNTTSVGSLCLCTARG